MALGWVFASFLQGVAGFGTPIAIVAPLLVAYGVKPVYAVVIPLVSHLWAKMFGTLGEGWLAMTQVVDMADPTATALQSAMLLAVPNLLGGLSVAWFYGRWPAVRHATPMVLIIALIHSGGQGALMLVTPILATFLAVGVALLALYPLSTWRRYDEPADWITERPAMQGKAEADDDDPKAPMGFGMSMLPYAVLAVVAVVALAIEPVQRLLGSVTVGMPFAATTTGYAVAREATDPYSPFAPLTHPGTILLVTSVLTWFVYRARGYYQAWAGGHDEGMLEGVVNDAVPSSMPIVAFLVTAKVMDHSGMILALALGIAAIAPPLVYAILANAVGAIGAFITASSTSSNVLFSGLQQSVAALSDLPEPTVLAAQSAGGTIGNAVAPSNIVMGTTTADIRGKEGEVLRITIPWTVLAVILTGLVTVAMVLLL